MFTKKNPQHGFTIVELLIVIVVIGILAAITVVAFNGVQQRALNASRVSEVQTWQKIFKVYEAQYGKYPPVASGNYCLGYGFPDGDGLAGGECRDYDHTDPYYYYHEVDSTALMDELKKVSQLPGSPRVPVNGTIGPYISYTPTSYTIISVFNGGSGDCPPPMKYNWADGNGRVLCMVTHLD